MSWYWWVLLWAFVLILALGVMVMLGLSLFGKVKELARELSTATERLGAVSEGLQELVERQSDPAVFTSASQLRQEQILSGRRRDGRAAPAKPVRPVTSLVPVKTLVPGHRHRDRRGSAYDDTDR